MKILIGTNLNKLARNISKRKDERRVSSVLKEFMEFFEPSDNKKKKGIIIRQSSLNKFKIKTKADKVMIERIKKKWFGEGSVKTLKIVPKKEIIYDKFVIL